MNSQEYGGPPDPIFSMRRRSSSGVSFKKYDDNEDDEQQQRQKGQQIQEDRMNEWEKSHQSNVEGVDSEKEKERRSTSPRREHQQDPPAREPPLDGGAWPERDALSFTRCLVFYGMGSITEEHEEACTKILEARSLRRKYYGGESSTTNIAHNNSDVLMNNKDNTYNNNNNKGGEKQLENKCDKHKRLDYRFGRDGVVELFVRKEKGDHHNLRQDESKTNTVVTSLVKVPSIDDFVKDYHRLVEICSSGAMRTFCFQRMEMMMSSFNMHITANESIENEEQRNLLGTDFYRTMKIDNHIHLAAAASAKQFVKFVGDKLKNEGNTVVMEDGQTLKDVFTSAGLSVDHLTIDAFNVLADYSVYQRFDNFNTKISPFRMANMRKIFLKVENALEGRYFAELTKTIFARLEQCQGHNSAAEMRLSIYGMEQDEWLKLAKWILKDWAGAGDYRKGPVLSTRNRWLVQIPRLWWKYYEKGDHQQGHSKERTFQDMLENLFNPLFEATLYPEENPEVAEFLTHIVGFDSVDDEGSSEAPCSYTRPALWKDAKNPSYAWQLYYLWANIEVLNVTRKSKGLNTFAFRPHAGETGDVMHLAAAYMLCTSINHGINLEHQISLQYLYYLDQVGLSVSPLSNNFLFRKIAKNPFPKLFKRGLNVTLSTDDPLLFHMSDDALLEEYSVARASFDLSMTDISEIARNSILQSGFEDELKEEWLGKDFKKGVTFCDETKTHVPLIRSKFRAERLAFEHMFINLIAAKKGDAALKEIMVQFGLARNTYRNFLIDLPDIPAFPEQNQL